MAAFGHSNGGGRRSAPRRRAPLMVLVCTTTDSHSALLVDISRSGARVRGPELPATGKEVLLSVEGVKAFGMIVWCHNEYRGVAFDPILKPGEVQKLTQWVVQAKGLSPEMKAAMDDWTYGAAR